MQGQTSSGTTLNGTSGSRKPFSKNDLTYMSPQFIELLSKNYTTDQSSPFLTVLHRLPDS